MPADGAGLIADAAVKGGMAALKLRQRDPQAGGRKREFRLARAVIAQHGGNVDGDAHAAALRFMRREFIRIPAEVKWFCFPAVFAPRKYPLSSRKHKLNLRKRRETAPIIGQMLATQGRCLSAN